MAEHRATAEENARAKDSKKKKHKRRAAPPASEQWPPGGRYLPPGWRLLAGWLNHSSYLVGHNLPEPTATQGGRGR
ncbi:unnamed protein product [Sphagnum jensenii]|uniref:Uncharacterized protein n=1 Tax=Sphagnum jensenii TaxID=128206 RepID=A0ABP1AQD0_9BRYO